MAHQAMYRLEILSAEFDAHIVSALRPGLACTMSVSGLRGRDQGDAPHVSTSPLKPTLDMVQ